jgi:tetratricopeptide (TPR) repeat protein
LKSSLSTPIQTTDFLNPPRSDPLELAVCMSLCNDYKNLYSFIKSVYIKEQSNDFLEYLTIISAYASGEYRESLFLAQDLLYSSPTREVFLIILKISVNHLDLPDTANHFSRLALEHHISDSILTTARAVVCLSLLKTSTYHSDRVALLEEARGLLDSSESTGKNVLFYRALTYAHLGMLNEALNFASEGMKVFMTGGYSALVALVMMAKEDFTGSLDVIKRGLKANPGNFLLYAVK